MYTAAALGKIVDDHLKIIVFTRAVAPQIRPVCAAKTGFEHRHRRLIRVQHRSGEQQRPHRVHQRRKPQAASTDPLRECRARQFEAGASEDGFLSVQR